MKKSPKTKKETTIDDLALMVQGGFKEMNERFKDVDIRFEEVNKKFEQVDIRFEEVNKRFEHVDRRFDILEHKFFARHEREIEQLRDRVLKLETKLRTV